MALQGTIDTFPLADVLQLLSASSKTGRLLLHGDRGRMALWIEQGDVVGGDAATQAGEQAELLIFEMLRFTDGEFAFDSDLDAVPTTNIEPAPLEQSLHRALELLDAWAAIEAVVPSPAHFVAMAPELREPSVEIDQATWRLLTATGRSVTQVADALELDEFSATSAIAELVEAGLLEIGEPGSIADVSSLYSTDEADDPDEEHESPEAEDPTVQLGDDGAGEDASFPDRFPIDDLIGGDEVDEDDPWSSPEMERLEAQRFAAAQSFEAIEVEPVPLGDPDDHPGARHPGSAVEDDAGSEADVGRSANEPGDETTDEVLRQMSKLSPQAAEAIAAALNSVPAGAADRGEDDGPDSFSGTF